MVRKAAGIALALMVSSVCCHAIGTALHEFGHVVAILALVEPIDVQAVVVDVSPIQGHTSMLGRERVEGNWVPRRAVISAAGHGLTILVGLVAAAVVVLRRRHSVRPRLILAGIIGVSMALPASDLAGGVLLHANSHSDVAKVARLLGGSLGGVEAVVFAVALMLGASVAVSVVIEGRHWSIRHGRSWVLGSVFAFAEVTYLLGTYAVREGAHRVVPYVPHRLIDAAVYVGVGLVLMAIAGVALCRSECGLRAGPFAVLILGYMVVALLSLSPVSISASWGHGMDEDSFAEKLMKAEVMLERGRCSDALPMFHDLRNASPTQDLLWIGEARAAHCAGQPDRSIEILKRIEGRVLPEDSSYAEVHYWLARNHHVVGNAEEACRHSVFVERVPEITTSGFDWPALLRECDDLPSSGTGSEQRSGSFDVD